MSKAKKTKKRTAKKTAKKRVASTRKKQIKRVARVSRADKACVRHIAAKYIAAPEGSKIEKKLEGALVATSKLLGVSPVTMMRSARRNHTRA